MTTNKFIGFKTVNDKLVIYNTSHIIEIIPDYHDENTTGLRLSYCTDIVAVNYKYRDILDALHSSKSVFTMEDFLYAKKINDLDYFYK
jgi:hypothetical protein